jgi:cell division protein FtsB
MFLDDEASREDAGSTEPNGCMAATATRRLSARAPARRAPSRGRAGKGGIRWDRVARLSLLFVLLAIMASYVGPAAEYLQSWRLAKETRAEVQELRADNERLRIRAKQLQDPQTIELEARRIGMGRPGERVYVVRGLTK